MQHSLSLPSTSGTVGQIELVVGPAHQPSEAAMRLLERALAESGLGRLARHSTGNGGADGRLVVAFGSEAATMLLRRPVSLALERGKVRGLGQGNRLLVTEHPEAILRLSDPVARGREYRRLVGDLQLAVPMPRLAA